MCALVAGRTTWLRRVSLQRLLANHLDVPTAWGKCNPRLNQLIQSTMMIWCRATLRRPGRTINNYSSCNSTSVHHAAGISHVTWLCDLISHAGVKPPANLFFLVTDPQPENNRWRQQGEEVFLFFFFFLNSTANIFPQLVIYPLPWPHQSGRQLVRLPPHFLLFTPAVAVRHKGQGVHEIHQLHRNWIFLIWILPLHISGSFTAKKSLPLPMCRTATHLHIKMILVSS